MPGNVVPTGVQPNGRRIKAYNAAVFAAYGSTCHLCGQPAADTVDHLIPTSRRPDLRWDVANGRPAHHRCNSARGNADLVHLWQAPAW